jgi:hypothetical protein
MPKGPDKKAMTDYFSTRFGFSTLDELKNIVSRNAHNLDDPVIKENVEMAKRIVGEDDLYNVSPNSRLAYVKRKLQSEAKGSRTLDPIAIAIFMQEVCGVSAGADPENSFAYLYHALRKDLLEETRVEKLKPLSKIEERELEKLAIGLEDAQVKYFENATFSTGLEAETPKPVQEFFDYMQGVYKNKFGEPEKIGEYHCPISQEILDFCNKVVEEETGVRPPQIKVFIDIEKDVPYLLEGKEKGVAIPSASIGSGITTVESLLNEMPHLVTNYNRLRGNDFVVDRKSFFKELARLEGIPEVVKEGAFRRILEKGYQKNASERAKNLMIKTYSERPVMLQFVSNAFLKYTTMENTVGFATYYTIAYPVGWYCLRKLEKPDFVSVVSDPESYERPDIGWNGKFSGDDRIFINNTLVKMNVETKRRYKDRPDLVKMASRQTDIWRKDFLM